jgi:hypothetical protein
MNSRQEVYGEAILFVQLPNDPLDPHPNEFTLVVFARMLYRQRDQEIFDCEVICRWTETYQIIPLVNVTQKVGLFQAKDKDNHLWTWICFRHHGAPVTEKEHYDELDGQLSNDPETFEGDIDMDQDT